MNNKKIIKSKELDIELLEKEVKKQQVQSFFKIVPILVTKKVLYTLFNIGTEKTEKKLYLPTSSKEDINKTSFLTTNNSNETIEINITTDKYKNSVVEIQEEQRKESNKEPSKFILPDLDISKVSLEKNIEDLSSDKRIETKKVTDSIAELSNNKNIENIKTKKLTERYELELKEIRRQLRTEIFSYNAVSENNNNLEELETLLEKTNLIIKKIEDLKDNITIENMNIYNDNYITNLISSYIEEFKLKKNIKDIKDSSLYILISEKLEELADKKEYINQQTEKEKEKQQIDEEKLIEIKERYSDFNNLNNKLEEFQKNQETLLIELQTKLENQTTIYEKEKVRILGAASQTKNLLNFTAGQMLLPGARSAKTTVAATAISLYYIRNLINPNKKFKLAKQIKIIDYSSEIESSIVDLDNIIDQINKTTTQIDLVIKEFKNNFKEYLGKVKEYDEVLKNLEKVSDEIKEKEYEIMKIREEQKLNLERNDLKVKKYES